MGSCLSRKKTKTSNSKGSVESQVENLEQIKEHPDRRLRRSSTKPRTSPIKEDPFEDEVCENDHHYKSQHKIDRYDNDECVRYLCEELRGKDSFKRYKSEENSDSDSDCDC